MYKRQELKDVRQPSGGLDSSTSYGLVWSRSSWRISPNLNLGHAVVRIGSDTTISDTFTSISTRTRTVGSFYLPDAITALMATGDYSLKMTARLIVRSIGDANTVRIGSSFFVFPRTFTNLGDSDFSTALSTTADTTVSLTLALTVPATMSATQSVSMGVGYRPASVGSRGITLREGSVLIVYLKAV